MIKYPYTDFHEMNLDWLLQQMKELNERMDNFVTEITADIIPIVQQAIEEGLIDVTYDSTNETVVLVPGAGVTSQHLAKFFQINNFKYPVADQTARNTINNWISGFNYTPGNMYKKAVFIGDSYLEGWTPDGTYESWGPRLASKLGLTVDTGAFIYAQGGAGFVATNNNRNFGTMLTEAVNDSRFNNDDVDLIVVGGGFNDQGSAYNTITAAISNFASSAKTNFPNARIYVVDMAWSQYTAHSRSNVYGKQRVEAGYFNGATNAGIIPISDCWKALQGLSPSGSALLASDDVHPNADGLERIARYIFDVISGGTPYLPHLTILRDTQVTSLFAEVTPSGVSVFLTGRQGVDVGNMSATSGACDGNGVYIDLLEIPGFRPVTNNRSWGTAYVLVQDDNGYHLINGIAGIGDGKIRIYLSALSATGSGYLTLVNARYIQIHSLSMFVPAIWA